MDGPESCDPPAAASPSTAPDDPARPERRTAGGGSASALRVALVQIAPRLADRQRNLALHLEKIAAARQQRADLVIFPELSLTGYFVRDMVPEVAIRRTAPEIQQLLQAAGPAALVAGFIEESPRHRFYNAALFAEEGRIVHLHRKVYLPTYGLFQEKRFFGEGQELGVVSLDAPGSGCGILICEDLWHAETARKLARGGARILIVISASPGRVGAGERPESLEDWEILTRSAALLNTSWVAYCNRVGWEEGSFYAGGSHFVRPGGEVLSRAPVLDPHLLIADLDLREVDRLRFKLPLLREERPEIRGPVVQRRATLGGDRER